MHSLNFIIILFTQLVAWDLHEMTIRLKPGLFKGFDAGDVEVVVGWVHQVGDWVTNEIEEALSVTSLVEVHDSTIGKEKHLVKHLEDG